MLLHKDVTAAGQRTAAYVRRTPLIASDRSNMWFKLELLQHTGVFKVRGAFNRIVAARERGELNTKVGITIASGGNAGLATAYAATVMGVNATVFVPTTAPQVKVDRLRDYGADVHLVGTEYAHAHEAATEFATRAGALLSHAYDHPDIAAGAGVITEEILKDEPTITTVVVAVGGGGLYAGTAAAARDRAHVVAVEPERIPTLHSAIQEQEQVDVPVSGVAADSLGARRIGVLALEAALADHPTSVLVNDESIAETRLRLWREHRLAVEHGAAAALAAIDSGAYVPSNGEKVAVILCGANTDPRTLI